LIALGRKIFEKALKATKKGLPIVNPSFVPNFWNMIPIARGNAIEDFLAVTEYRSFWRVGALYGGYFPLFDFADAARGLAVSLKTVDTRGATWLWRMRSHIDKLANDYDVTLVTPDGVEKTATKVLDIRVQPGGREVAESLEEYGAERGITVIVRELDPANL
jgi:filamentous hemagglutinin